MSDLEPRRLSVGHGLNLDRAESVIAELGDGRSRTREIEIDLDACEHIDVGAGWRLGNFLSRLKDSCYLKMTVPAPRDFKGNWFQNFTRSGLGFAIARYADEVLVGDQQITEEIRQYYANAKSTGVTMNRLKGYLWQAQNFCMVTSLDQGVLSSDDVGEFGSTILNLLDHVSFDADAYRKEDVYRLIDLMFQSVQNVYDHAAKKPLPSNTSILSYISLRYYKRINPLKIRNSEFSQYLCEINSLPSNCDFVGYIEFVVNDDGVGMAARQSLSSEIYSTPIELEKEVLAKVLLAGESVKPYSHDCLLRGDPGYGMSRIEGALIRLKAFAALRTGRLISSLNPFRGDRFSLHDTALGYMPGTTLQVILPCRRNALWSSFD